jgi:hypothetical protein
MHNTWSRQSRHYQDLATDAVRQVLSLPKEPQPIDMSHGHAGS